MIYLVYGEDTVKSRAVIINQQKKLGLPKAELAIRTTTPQQLYECCASESLFGEAPFVVLDISEASRTELDDYVTVINKIPQNTTLVIYSGKTLPKSHVLFSKIPKETIRVMEFQKFAEGNVFRFIDALYSKNRLHTYKELNKLRIEDYDDFYILGMVYYGLRSLAKVLWNAPSSRNYKPFQRSKLETQLQNFNQQTIKTLFAQLYTFEKKAKTGVIAAGLAVTLTIEKVLNS